MKRAALFPVSLALGSILLGATRKPIFGNSDPHPLPHSGLADRAFVRAFAFVLSNHMDSSAIAARRELTAHEAGTYIGDILRERDSSLARWPDREGNPLRVWIQPQAALQDFRDAYVRRVRDAFIEWNSVKLPVQFSFVADSASADVHVDWIDHFDEPISGRTRWVRDDDWMISEADIVLAVHHSQGDRLDGASMQALALHEIGHLIGLDHTADTLSIMAPRVRVRELSPADRATAQLLYQLPAGPLGN